MKGRLCWLELNQMMPGLDAVAGVVLGPDGARLADWPSEPARTSTNGGKK